MAVGWEPLPCGAFIWTGISTNRWWFTVGQCPTVGARYERSFMIIHMSINSINIHSDICIDISIQVQVCNIYIQIHYYPITHGPRIAPLRPDCLWWCACSPAAHWAGAPQDGKPGSLVSPGCSGAYSEDPLTCPIQNTSKYLSISYPSCPGSVEEASPKGTKNEVIQPARAPTPFQMLQNSCNRAWNVPRASIFMTHDPSHAISRIVRHASTKTCHFSRPKNGRIIP